MSEEENKGYTPIFSGGAGGLSDGGTLDKNFPEIPVRPPKPVGEFSWRSFGRNFASALMEFWGSIFTLLLVLLMLSALLFGIDCTERRWGYLVLDFVALVCSLRCLTLVFSGREDNIYRRLTRH